jgi:hypothetical protein
MECALPEDRLSSYSDPLLQLGILQGRLISTLEIPNHAFGYAEQNPISFGDPFGLKCYIQSSTGTRVCEGNDNLGLSKNWSPDGSNSVFPPSTNCSCTIKCQKNIIKGGIVGSSLLGQICEKATRLR